MRHAQGQHNVSASYDYDPPLTLEGHDQVEHSLPSPLISTPLSRGQEQPLYSCPRMANASPRDRGRHRGVSCALTLTAWWWDQVTAARQITGRLDPELVLVSPLRRTLQTAVGCERATPQAPRAVLLGGKTRRELTGHRRAVNLQCSLHTTRLERWWPSSPSARSCSTRATFASTSRASRRDFPT